MKRTTVSTVTLTIKDVPSGVVSRIEERAERHGRSLQDELLVILEESVAITTLADIAAFAQRLGLESEAGESVRMIREDRDDPSR
jgi:plasmid stability protein